MEEFFGFLVFTLILSVALFLPALFELKKPKDNGPRKIIGFEVSAFIKAQKKPELTKQSIKGKVPVVALDALPNLDV